MIPASRFIELLQDRDGLSRLSRNPTTVMNDVDVDGKKIKIATGSGEKKIESIRLDNFNFLGRVRIEHFETLSFTADNSNFLKGLSFEGCSGSWLSIRNCCLESFDGFRNKFEVLNFEKVEGPPTERPEWQCHPTLTISGYELSREFALKEVQLKELVLTSHTEERFKAAAAKVDDPLWALQLQLAGIKVYVSTEVAAKMLEKGSFAERVRSVA